MATAKKAPPMAIVVAPTRRARARAAVVKGARAAGGAVKKGARAAGRGIARGAKSEAHTLIAVGAAGALGLLKRFGIRLPRLPVIGTSGTYGLGLWATDKFFLKGRGMLGKVVQHSATGLLAVCAHNLAAGDEATAGEGDDDDDDNGDD